MAAGCGEGCDRTRTAFTLTHSERIVSNKLTLVHCAKQWRSRRSQKILISMGTNANHPSGWSLTSQCCAAVCWAVVEWLGMQCAIVSHRLLGRILAFPIFHEITRWYVRLTSHSRVLTVLRYQFVPPAPVIFICIAHVVKSYGECSALIGHTN